MLRTVLCGLCCSEHALPQMSNSLRCGLAGSLTLFTLFTCHVVCLSRIYLTKVFSHLCGFQQICISDGLMAPRIVFAKRIRKQWQQVFSIAKVFSSKTSVFSKEDWTEQKGTNTTKHSALATVAVQRREKRCPLPAPQEKGRQRLKAHELDGITI